MNFNENCFKKCVLCNQPPQPGQKGLDLLLICSDCKKDHHPGKTQESQNGHDSNDLKLPQFTFFSKHV